MNLSTENLPQKFGQKKHVSMHQTHYKSYIHHGWLDCTNSMLKATRQSCCDARLIKASDTVLLKLKNGTYVKNGDPTNFAENPLAR